MSLYFLTFAEYQKIRSHTDTETSLWVSLDLGLTQLPVRICGNAILLPSGEQLPVPEFPAEDTRTIYIWKANAWQKWQMFDARHQEFVKAVFVREGAPPTVEINGIKMHVTQDGDPGLDTQNKLRALGRIRGRVLDTCCGLGYTAAGLARQKGVEWVLTVEKSSQIIQLVRENPWSRAVLESPKITLIQARVEAFLETLPDAYFQAILHDPPTVRLTPELYQVSFYRQCWRVLKRGGKLYHYTGQPYRQRQREIPSLVQSRLKAAGFARIRKSYQGVVAWKL